MRLRPDFAYLLVLLVQFGFGGGINAAGFGFSVEEVVDYFPMVKLVDGAVKRNLSLIHISEPTRRTERSRMPSSA